MPVRFSILWNRYPSKAIRMNAMRRTVPLLLIILFAVLGFRTDRPDTAHAADGRMHLGVHYRLPRLGVAVLEE